MDEIDKTVDKQKLMKTTLTCPLCLAVYNKSKIKCDVCKVNIREASKQVSNESEDTEEHSAPKQMKIVEKEINFRPEDSFGSQTVATSDLESESSRTDVGIGSTIACLDPIPLNPNSYENIKLILRKIGVDANIARYKATAQNTDRYCRQWLFVMCDGLPYVLAHKVIHESHYCTFCKDSFLGYETFKAHMRQSHQTEQAQIILEFDWVILLIGKGHVEMNMIKSFFELNWEPFLKDLAKRMGYCTENAQRVAKFCKKIAF